MENYYELRKNESNKRKQSRKNRKKKKKRSHVHREMEADTVNGGGVEIRNVDR
jgi:hypothetical protein